MREYASSVSPKGQVTLPIEVRRRWGLRARDRVAFRVEEDIVTLMPARSPVEESFGAVPPLTRSLSVEQMTDIAADEHAQDAAREGVERG